MPRWLRFAPERRHRAALLTALAVVAVYLSLPLIAEGDALQITSLALLGTVGGGVVGAITRAAWRCEARSRLAWLLLAAAVALWSASQFLSLVWLNAHPGTTTRMPAADDLLIVATTLAVAGFATLPRSRSTHVTGRVLRGLDTITVMSTAMMASWMMLIGPVLSRASVASTAKWELLTFAAFDISTVTLSMLLASRPPAGYRVASSYLAGAAFTFASSDVHFLRGLVDGTYTVGGIGDVGWLIGVVLLAAAAARWTRPSSEQTAVSSWRSVLLPYALLPATLALAILTVAHGHPLDVVVVALGSVMLAAILARQLITLAENLKLVSQMSGQEAELRHQAMHDALTGLANRRLFRDRLEEAVRAAYEDDDVAVVFVDLDDFKVVNDTLGHAVGDELLRKMANRLQACIRTSDLAARLGGDEFAVLLTRGGALAGQNVATRLTRAMRQPIVIAGEPIFIQASVGIAVGTAELRRSPGELLEQADMAMYAAKDAGKARLAVFEPGMRERLVGRAAVKDDLHRALGRGQLLLHYQPIVDLRSGLITGAEALLRWQHPQHGFIPPLTFIPMAEETGLINRIGRWALQMACREAIDWPDSGGVPLSINVNFSAAQLLNPDVIAEVGTILVESGLAPERLTIEMTESVLMNDNAAVAAQLSALKTLGVRVAIDDFGTGYSGLSYLDRLPVDILKVDKAFVDKLDENHAEGGTLHAGRPPLARAVVGLADMLGLDVVAEGIETLRQREVLVAMGCPTGQGYFFSRPVPSERLRELLQQGSLSGELSDDLQAIAAPRAASDFAAGELAARELAARESIA